MGEPAYNEDSELHYLKKRLDSILPVVIVLIVIYLYLDLVASSQNILYGYKAYFQYSILAYFVIDLAVLFTMYEENKNFSETTGLIYC